MSDESQEAGTRARPIGAASRLDLKRAKVLIVDDNQPSLDILAQTLKGFGVRNLTQARSGADAIQVLVREAFDVVIVDGEMPVQDGFDLAENIRADTGGPNYTVAIVLLTSFTPRDKIMRARDAGVNLVVTKPLVPGVLLGRLEWLARNTRQFVTSPGYCGPDRRFKKVPLPEGIPERRAEEIKLISQPERAMSQNEIDNIFG